MPKSTITLCPCESKQLAAFGYDPATRTLADHVPPEERH